MTEFTQQVTPEEIYAMTPDERVFGTLRNIEKIIRESGDLNEKREILLLALDRAISWEGQLVSK